MNGESGKAQSKLIMLSGDNTFYLSTDTGSLLPQTQYDVESAWWQDSQHLSRASGFQRPIEPFVHGDGGAPMHITIISQTYSCETNLGYKRCFNGAYHFCWLYTVPFRMAKGIHCCPGYSDEYGNCNNIGSCLFDLCWNIQITWENGAGKCIFSVAVVPYLRNDIRI